MLFPWKAVLCKRISKTSLSGQSLSQDWLDEKKKLVSWVVFFKNKIYEAEFNISVSLIFGSFNLGTPDVDDLSSAEVKEPGQTVIHCTPTTGTYSVSTSLSISDKFILHYRCLFIHVYN